MEAKKEAIISTGEATKRKRSNSKRKTKNSSNKNNVVAETIIDATNVDKKDELYIAGIDSAEHSCVSPEFKIVNESEKEINEMVESYYSSKGLDECSVGCEPSKIKRFFSRIISWIKRIFKK